jgi:hypothetical protein
MRHFENLREQLLRAGIPPRHANRYVSELREHLADLEEQGRNAGLDAVEAKEHALALLGSEAQLAQAMIEKSPRSLAARAPWLVLALIPVLLLVCFIRFTNLSMMYLLSPLGELAPAGMPGGYVGLIATVSFIATYLAGPLLAAGCVVAAVRQRLSSRWLWVGLALVAVISGFLGFHVHFNSPGSWAAGVRFSALGVVYEGRQVDAAATVGLALLRAALLFAAAAMAYRVLNTRSTWARS